MTTALIVSSSRARLWGLTSHERLVRQLRSIEGIALAEDPLTVDDGERVLILRADYAYDQRTLSGLLANDGLLLDGEAPAAAHVDGALALVGWKVVRAGAAQPQWADLLPTIDRRSLDGFEGDLRKTEAPLLAPIKPETAQALEDRLYGISYKGITDFITKWWWPVPAKAVVRWCADRGITPNVVTCAGCALMLAACWLFYAGWYFWGLLFGWLMTFLDTVDGKLARVTVQSSRFGHWLDHGMDILHPPFWYLLWWLSLSGVEPRLGIDFDLLMVFVVAGYVGGRLIEGAFHALGAVSLFAWRPFDAWFRLFTARRNPCLLLLTLGWLLGEPGLGFELVAIWTLVSSAILVLRLVYAGGVRLASGPLTSWLADEDAQLQHPRSFRTFSTTRRAYG